MCSGFGLTPLALRANSLFLLCELRDLRVDLLFLE